MPENVKQPEPMQLFDQTYLILQKISEIQELDELIALCCTTLDASLFIHDAQGNVIAHSPFEDAPCPAWEKRLEPGRVRPILAPDSRNMRPMSNTLRHERCAVDGCTRLYFPLHSQSNMRPNVLNIFIWHTDLTPREQSLAAVFAGAFSALLQRSNPVVNPLHQQQIILLSDLLDYKAGLKPYYLRRINQLRMADKQSPYRALFIHGPDDDPKKLRLLVHDIAHRLPHMWCFEHGEYLVAVFNEDRLAVRTACDALLPYFTQQHMTACLSMPFYDLLRLRFVFEDCLNVLPIAAKKEPDARICHAEHYQCFAFLSRCQQYFPLQDYYPEGLTRLMEYDRENGRAYHDTLSAYLENNMNANAAAKQIFMHRNTMMQQLEKIEQIMGVSLEDKEMCLYLQLCLRMHELLEL